MPKSKRGRGRKKEGMMQKGREKMGEVKNKTMEEMKKWGDEY